MSHFSDRAPALDNQKAWDWIRPNYQIPSFSYYPSSPVDGYVFLHTGNQHYYQWDANLSPPDWIDLGPSTNFFFGNVPTGTSPLQISDTNPNHLDGMVNLFLVYITEGNPGPLLMVDQGFIVKKDLMVGGLIDSGQGAIWLNYGLVGRPLLSSPPCIEMMASPTPYPSGTSFPSNPENGQLFNLTSTYNGYASGYYIWNGNTGVQNWIYGSYYSGLYDTLFLFKADGITRANLDLGTLDVHDNIYSDVNKTLGFFGSTGGSYPFNLGMVDFKDIDTWRTSQTGDRILDFKGYYNTSFTICD